MQMALGRSWWRRAAPPRPAAILPAAADQKPGSGLFFSDQGGRMASEASVYVCVPVRYVYMGEGRNPAININLNQFHELKIVTASISLIVV